MVYLLFAVQVSLVKVGGIYSRNWDSGSIAGAGQWRVELHYGRTKVDWAELGPCATVMVSITKHLMADF